MLDRSQREGLSIEAFRDLCGFSGRCGLNLQPAGTVLHTDNFTVAQR
jgi:hypothetical protein